MFISNLDNSVVLKIGFKPYQLQYFMKLFQNT